MVISTFHSRFRFSKITHAHNFFMMPPPCRRLICTCGVKWRVVICYHVTRRARDAIRFLFMLKGTFYHEHLKSLFSRKYVYNLGIFPLRSETKCWCYKNSWGILIFTNSKLAEFFTSYINLFTNRLFHFGAMIEKGIILLLCWDFLTKWTVLNLIIFHPTTSNHNQDFCVRLMTILGFYSI
jgi:hypothetical protein